jgi:hypothetical protein
MGQICIHFILHPTSLDAAAIYILFPWTESWYKLLRDRNTSVSDRLNCEELRCNMGPTLFRLSFYRAPRLHTLTRVAGSRGSAELYDTWTCFWASSNHFHSHLSKNSFYFGSFYDDVTIWIIQRRMVGWMRNGELERIWKETVAA